MGRKYDIVMYGATGFTGRLVVEYYLKTYGPGPEPLSWAVAGRSKDKLEKVLGELEKTLPGAKNVPVVVCDSDNAEALAAMASQTKVVVTTVGPYTKYGMKLVEACATNGTSCVDLTGEPLFMKDTVSQFEGKAKASGAKIVHCCGFDSEPSDLGTLVVWQEMKKQGIVPKEIKYIVGPFNGGASGGTIASMGAVLELAIEQGRLKEMGHPHLYVSKGSKSLVRVKQHVGIGWDSDVKRWTIPFVMAAVNTKVVARSGSLLGYDAFEYSETMSFPGTVMGFFTTLMTMLGMSWFFLAFLFPPTRWLILKYLPAGSGPSAEARKKGFCVIYMVGKGTTKDGKEAMVRATVTINGDPGYQETAKMIGESGVCLAKDKLAPGGGILTPASAMGNTLIERLNARSLSITIDK